MLYTCQVMIQRGVMNHTVFLMNQTVYPKLRMCTIVHYASKCVVPTTDVSVELNLVDAAMLESEWVFY
jgi:hypothetical protein